MKEVTIATRNDGHAVCDIVAYVDPRSLKHAGINEDSFRKEVLNIYAAEILKPIVREMFGEFVGESKDSARRNGSDSQTSPHEVRDKAVRRLLDAGIRVEVRRIEGGKRSVVSRLTLTSTGVVEKKEEM